MKNCFSIFGENAFRIPNEERKRPINMALYESLSYLMSFDAVTNEQINVKEKVYRLFEDKEFLDALTERIDSSKSVDIRFSKVKTILKEIDNAKQYS
jgi:hypothetical protein